MKHLIYLVLILSFGLSASAQTKMPSYYPQLAQTICEQLWRHGSLWSTSDSRCVENTEAFFRKFPTTDVYAAPYLAGLGLAITNGYTFLEKIDETESPVIDIPEAMLSFINTRHPDLAVGHASFRLTKFAKTGRYYTTYCIYTRETGKYCEDSIERKDLSLGRIIRETNQLFFGFALTALKLIQEGKAIIPK